MSDAATELMKRPASSCARPIHRHRPYPKSRKVQNLQWAEYLDFTPFGRRRLNSAQRMGMRYEAAFGRMLRKRIPSGARLDHDKWIQFEDQNGSGYACPDWVLHGTKRLFVFENKLSWHRDAWEQPQLLYGPLLEEIEGKPTVSVVGFRNPRDFETQLSRMGSGMVQVHSLPDVLNLKPGQIGFWHWLPR